jgi:hypothetical protein
MLAMSKKEKIQQLWLDPKQKGSLSSVYNFIKNNPKFKSEKLVLKSLSELESFSTHHFKKRGRGKFAKVVAHFPGYLYAGNIFMMETLIKTHFYV